MHAVIYTDTVGTVPRVINGSGTLSVVELNSVDPISTIF